MDRGTKNLNKQRSAEHFFDCIRGQILTALANRKMCEDLHLMGKLAIFENDRKEGGKFQKKPKV